MDLNGFVRREAGGMIFHACLALEELPDVRHGFSTRGGAQESLNLTPLPWDSPERVENNRSRFLSALGLERARLVTLAQVHSDRIQIFDTSSEDLDRRREGDALATRLNGVVLGVQVADCFPILLADPKTGALAAVHSGWRGTVSRILLKTIEAMKQHFGANPSSLIAAIGPGIRACCMEVGPEVAEKFEAEYPGCSLTRRRAGRDEKHLLDLPRGLAIQCAEAGLATERVHDMGACTCCHPEEFFSYRAEGAAAGRMMAAIGRM